MDNKTCSVCGKVTDNWKEWSHCKGCGTDYCPECHSKHVVDHVAEDKSQREAQKREQALAARGDMDAKKRLVCPKCNTEIHHLYF